MLKLKKFFLTFFLFLIPLATLAQETEEDFKAEPAKPVSGSYEKARVLEMNQIYREAVLGDLDYSPEVGVKIITVEEIKLKIISGEHKSEERAIESSVASNPLDLDIKTGDTLLVYIEKYNNGDWTIQIQDHYRLPALLLVVGIFILVLLLIGGKQGLKALISLALAIILIFYALIPMALKGYNPIWLSLIIASVVTIMTFLIISGRKRKTLSAIVGTVSGLIMAAVLAIIFGRLAHLNGLGSEDSRQLFSLFPNLNFSGLLFAGILIGALGAVMDVSMSISSAASEIKQANKDINLKELISACYRVGRDIMATMSNTLIFAYVGSSLFLLLLFTNFGESYLKFLNFDFVAEEVVRSMAGSIGLVLVIPITAIVAGIFESKNK